LPLALAAGCASVQAPFEAHLEAASARVRDCAAWYAALDRAVDQAGVRDVQQAPVAGFPYLRVDRSMAGLRPRANRSQAAYHAYVERLAHLDFTARGHEIRNLPRGQLDRLPGFDADLPRSLAIQRTRDCGKLLATQDLARPQARDALLERASVPDEYSSGARIAGLYPLTRLALAGGVRRWELRTQARFERKPDSGVLAVRYAPPRADVLSRRAVAGLIARANFDPLQLLLLSESEVAELAAAYAPSFEVPIAGDSDRFGALRWRRDADMPQVDASRPTVYVHPAQMRYGETVLLQLIYTVWFPERPARGAVDFLAGRLDAVMWRVTLAPDGEPLLYDSIHACGCYHLFFPTPRARLRPAPDAMQEWAFVPQTLPRVAEGERPRVRLASATHYIEGVELVSGPDSLTRYMFDGYDKLRSLPRFGGGHRSVFGPDGIVAGSERLERWLLWPAGVPSAGAMRQWGRHATAFVGRRHFDDADLLERRFELDLGSGS
jgi:hypothetical protein